MGRGFALLGVCNYCGEKKIVRFDDDIHAEDLGKICNECETIRDKQSSIVDRTINKIMGVTPYNTKETDDLRLELSRLKYVRLSAGDI